MAGLTADQIVERIANANGTESAVMRRHIEQVLPELITHTVQAHSIMPGVLCSDGTLAVDEWIVILEHDLYNTLMPRFPGWEWDGAGYRNTILLGKKQ